MERTNTNRTSKDQILRSWMYFQKVYKAHEEITLESEKFEFPQPHNAGNYGIRTNLETAFRMRRLKTANMFSHLKTLGVSDIELKEFFRNEMYITGKTIRESLDKVQDGLPVSD